LDVAAARTDLSTQVIVRSPRVRLLVREPLQNRVERSNPRVRLDHLEALELEHPGERAGREVHQMIATIERRGALVQHPAGEALDIRNDHEQRAAWLEQLGALAQHPSRPVYVLEHRVERDAVEAPPLD